MHGTLNLEAKLRNTRVGGKPAVQSVLGIGGPGTSGTDALHQDRIHAWVDPGMPAALRQQPKDFTELLEWENELFHQGYPVSFKQRVPCGSIQFSFAEHPSDNGWLAADIDIDLCTGIEHWGKVLANFLTTLPTDPFSIYVQLFDQHIFPLYVVKP